MSNFVPATPDEIAISLDWASRAHEGSVDCRVLLTLARESDRLRAELAAIRSGEAEWMEEGMIYADESAFPVTEHDLCGNTARENYGLTKREHFAAMAMQGMLARSYALGEQEPPQSTMIDWAVRCADDLLDALRTSKEGAT